MKAAVFDMDGLMLDTERVCIQAWDYAGEKELDSGLFIHQLNRYGDLLQNGYIEGIIFCSGAIGDLELETNRILKQWVADRGEAELPKERL